MVVAVKLSSYGGERRRKGPQWPLGFKFVKRRKGRKTLLRHPPPHVTCLPHISPKKKKEKPENSKNEKESPVKIPPFFLGDQKCVSGVKDPLPPPFSFFFKTEGGGKWGLKGPEKEAIPPLCSLGAAKNRRGKGWRKRQFLRALNRGEGIIFWSRMSVSAGSQFTPTQLPRWISPCTKAKTAAAPVAIRAFKGSDTSHKYSRLNMDTSLCGRKDHFLIVASASLSSGIPFLFPPSTTKVCDPHIPETTRERERFWLYIPPFLPLPERRCDTWI